MFKLFHATQLQKILIIQFIISLCILLCNLSVKADQIKADRKCSIIADDTLGTLIKTDDNNFTIHGGKVKGSNLFHSFDQFNLYKGETAIFNISDSGPDIKNIISRVTGNESSWINGTIKSDIQNINMYLLNPLGVFFGSNAAINISGAFHVSTSDFLRMQNNDDFFSKPIKGESLTSSPPIAFGFESNDIHSISLENVKLSCGTISLIAGKIEMDSSELKSDEGRINIVSITSKGIINLSENDIEMFISESDGNISLYNSTIDISGKESGNLFIRGGQFYMENSRINAKTNGNSSNVEIITSEYVKLLKRSDIVTRAIFTDKKAGDITIRSEDVFLYEGSSIQSESINGYGGGNIKIKANESFILKDHFSLILASAVGPQGNQADGGNIIIEAKNISLIDGGGINSTIDTIGQGGNVELYALESIQFHGIDNKGFASTIYTSTKSQKNNLGNAGNIIINANNVLFKDGGGVIASTKGTGNGGIIDITAKKISIDGTNPHGENIDGIATSINSRTESSDESAGNGGDIKIDTEILSITGGARITTSSFGSGDSGNININSNDMVYVSGNDLNAEYQEPLQSQIDYQKNIPSYSKKESISGIYSQSESRFENPGDAGEISITAESIQLDNTGLLTTSTFGRGNAGNINLIISKLNMNNESSVASESKAENSGGYAGSINIDSDNEITLLNHSTITTEAVNTEIPELTDQEILNKDKNNGKINIQAKNQICLINSQISSSVLGGLGNGGNIDIDPKLVILNHSQIIANAYQGNGGNINIVADHFVKSSDSIISASSEFGLDGSTDIKAVNFDAESISSLPVDYLNTDTLEKNNCSKHIKNNKSNFIVNGYSATPTPFDDWLASRPIINDQLKLIKNYSIKKGLSFFNTGNFELAAQYLEDGIKQSNKVNADILIFLSHAYQSIGHHKKALQKLENTLATFEKMDKTPGKALILNSLGDLYLILGNLEKSVDCFIKAKEEALQENNPYILAMVYNNVGNALAVDGDFEAAMAAYEECILQCNRLKNQNIKSQVYVNLVRVTWLMNDSKDCLTDLEEAFLTITNLSDSIDKAIGLVSLGDLAMAINQTLSSPDKKIITLSYNAIKFAKQIAQKYQATQILSYTYGYTAQLYEQENRYKEAITLTRKAIYYAQISKFKHHLYLWQWQLGRLFELEEKNNFAIKSYKNAVKTLNPIRNDFFKGYHIRDDRFNKRIKPVYLELAGLLLKEAEYTKNESLKQKIIIEARNTMDLLKTAELENFFIDECLSSKKVIKNKFKQTDDKTALIYPILFSNRLVILLTLPDGTRQIVVELSIEQFNETVKRFRKRLQTRTNNRYLHEAWQIYNWLISPIESLFDDYSIDTLIFAPDGTLRLIPIAALHDGKKFLIEKFAVVTVPSISLTDTNISDKENNKILLTGISESVQGFSKLPNVPEELKDIKEIMDVDDLMQDKDFTIENFKKKLADIDYSTAHMATHGVFGGDVDNTFLLTYDSQITMNSLEKLMQNNNKIELLTLSACQTAMGNEQAALGLAGVAVKAGVKTVIATLWFVNDKATSLLTREFYRQYKTSDISKAQALQNVQKALISIPAFSHPAYWSPYLLIGNWK